MKPGDTVTGSEPMPCVFCTGTIFRLNHDKGLIHTVPPCPTFVRLSPEDFIAAALAHVEGKQLS